MDIEMKDDGFEKVRLLNADGTKLFEKDIDLWDVQSNLYHLLKAHEGKPAYEYHAALVDYFKKMGFPPISHRFASQLADRINARVKELKNALAGGPSAGSPASTASTPSA